MGGLRVRRGTRTVQQGTFEAHAPRTWTRSSDAVGSHYEASGLKLELQSRRRPPSAPLRNCGIINGRLSSEIIGLHTGVSPLARQRPPSKATMHFQNPAVRDGTVSSEPYGFFAGIKPRRLRPQSAPSWRVIRSSDIIGTHSGPQSLDHSNISSTHHELQLQIECGNGSNVRSELRTQDTLDANKCQQDFISHNEQTSNAADRVKLPIHLQSTTKRVDGQLMEKVCSELRTLLSKPSADTSLCFFLA